MTNKNITKYDEWKHDATNSSSRKKIKKLRNKAIRRISNNEIKKAKASDFSGDLSFNFFRI